MHAGTNSHASAQSAVQGNMPRRIASACAVQHRHVHTAVACTNDNTGCALPQPVAECSHHLASGVECSALLNSSVG